MTDVEILARKGMFAIEPDRIYRLRAVLRRRVNVPGGENDDIHFTIAWYDYLKVPLISPVATIAEVLSSLTTADGRTELEATVSRTQFAGVDMIAPASARYLRPYVQVYGGTHQTDVEVISVEDATEQADLIAIEGELAGLETEINDLQLNDRVTTFVDVASTITTSSAYTGTLPITPGTGTRAIFRPNATSVGIATLNAIPIHTADGNNLSEGMLTAGRDYEMIMTATPSWRVVGRPFVTGLTVWGSAGTNFELPQNNLNLGKLGEAFPRLKFGIGTAGQTTISVGDGTVSPALALRLNEGDNLSVKTSGPIYDRDNKEVFSPANRPLVTLEGMTGHEIGRLLRDLDLPIVADNVTGLTLASAKAWNASFADAGRCIVANHADAKLDVQHFAIGVAPLEVIVLTGATLAVYCGQTPSWFGQAAGDKTLTFPAGSHVHIRRPLNSTFTFAQHSGAPPTASALAPAARDFSYATAGQSLAVRNIDLSGLRGLQDQLALAGIAKDVWAIQGAFGASALLLPGDGTQSDNYWLNSSGGNAPYTAGPCLTAFLANVAAAVALGQPQPSFVLIDLGQTDAEIIGKADTPVSGGVYPTEAQYRAAWEALIGLIRDGMPTPDASLPILLVPLNGDNSTGPGTAAQYTAVRGVQLDVIRTVANVYMGPNTYDLIHPIYDLHPIAPATRRQGTRLGIIYENAVEAGSEDEGPEIIAVLKNSNTRYDVIIDKATTMDLPNPVEGFAFLPSSATSLLTAVPEFPYQATWGAAVAPYEGHTRLILELRTGEAGMMKLFYPYGHLDRMMRTQRIVRYLTGSWPLKPYWPGF